MNNPSGVKGPIGALVDRFDRRPVVGAVMTTLVAIIGTVYACSNPGPDDCQKDPLRHVGLPSRLQVVEKCAHVTGTVVAWRLEHDGDYHVSMRMDERGWVNRQNVLRQHGYTVVEFVPHDPRPTFKVGQRLELTGTKVLDVQHGGWAELHPVFAVREVSKPAVTRPNQKRLAPTTEKD